MTFIKNGAAPAQGWPEVCILDAEAIWGDPIEKLCAELGVSPSIWRFDSYFRLISYLDHHALAEKSEVLVFINPVGQLIRSVEQMVNYLRSHPVSGSLNLVLIGPEGTEGIPKSIEPEHVSFVWDGDSENLAVFLRQIRGRAKGDITGEDLLPGAPS